MFLKLHPRLAPIKAAVFPLVKKDGMPEVAREIYKTLKPHMTVFYDEKSAVGRRYRRQDEVGTPFCITVDGQTLQDGTVTIRDRDTLRAMARPQGRVPGRVEGEAVLALQRYVSGKMGTGSVAQTGTVLGETSSPRCLSPFFRGTPVVRRKRGQAPSPEAVSASKYLSRRRSQSSFADGAAQSL